MCTKNLISYYSPYQYSLYSIQLCFIFCDKYIYFIHNFKLNSPLPLSIFIVYYFTNAYVISNTHICTWNTTTKSNVKVLREKVLPLGKNLLYDVPTPQLKCVCVCVSFSKNTFFI